jgi:hypothetical protein
MSRGSVCCALDIFTSYTLLKFLPYFPAVGYNMTFEMKHNVCEICFYIIPCFQGICSSNILYFKCNTNTEIESSFYLISVSREVKERKK